MYRMTGNNMIWKSNHVRPITMGHIMIPFPSKTTVTSVMHSAPIKQGK